MFCSVNDRSRRGALLGCATLLALMLSGAGCTPPPAEGEIEFSPEVFVETVGTGDVEDRIVCTGTLRSPETSSLRADTAGALAIGSDSAGRRLAEGSRVQAGQVIAEITGEEVRLAARTDANRERYETAKRDYDSTRSLHADGLVSEAELASAEANVAEALVELERSRLTETRSKLTTPIAGVIISLARDDRGRPLPDGQLVAQGQVVAEIAPTSRLIADVDVVGPDVARISPGQTARVRHHAWDDERFSGRVSRLAPTLDPTTRTLRAEVAVNNGGGKLRPGMFVEATVIAERREGVVVAPRQAVTERQGRKVVFVIRGQRVEKREIALGLGDDETVEVRSGLEAGERVVVRGLETLTDNNKVNVSGS